MDVNAYKLTHKKRNLKSIMIDGQNTTKSINKVIQYFDEEEQNEKV